MSPTAWDDRGVSRRRTITPVLPAEIAVEHGLAYALWMPADGSATGGIVVLHGAGSCKESHYDFAREALPLGFAALTFDARGHGESDGPMDGHVLEDIAAMAGVLRDAIGEDRPVALQGIEHGRVHGAGRGPVEPAPPRWSRSARRARWAYVEAWSGAPSRSRLTPASSTGSWPSTTCTRSPGSLDVPVLLLHAEGDEQVPVEHSRELASALAHPDSRLIAVPGGHHRSVQHDHELQAVSLKFIARAFSGA